MTSQDLKTTLAPFRKAAETATPDGLRSALDAVIAPDATLQMCHPFGDLTGPAALFDTVYAPLLAAMPDLERRDMIVVAGTTPEGQEWDGCMGSYMGTFLAPFSGIPPTGHLAHMRCHEFYRIEDGRVTGMQAIWDVPELMMLARAWPMAPQLGAVLNTPAPISGDGLRLAGEGQAAMDHVIAMLIDVLDLYRQLGVDVLARMADFNKARNLGPVTLPDPKAFAVMDVLRSELGLSVPGDVLIVGYDDVPVAAWLAYELTTLRQPLDRMVEATVDTLLDLIEDLDRLPEKIEIAGPPIVRGTARIPQGWTR